MAIQKRLKPYQKVKKYLKDNGLKQNWFAEQVNINRTELSRKLKGDVLFSSSEFTRINKRFKTDFKL